MAGVAGLVGFGVFIAACLAVGAGLLIRARRTRQAPELALGGALLGVGTGYALFILSFSLRLVPDALLRPAHLVATAGLDLGVAWLGVAVWSVFRPGRSWAEGAFALLATALTVHFAAAIAGFDPSGRRSALVFWLYHAPAAAVWLWAAAECLAHHAALRSRARLGLADAAPAGRFLWLGLAAAAAGGIVASGMANRLGTPLGVHPAALLAQAFGAGAAGVCLALAFWRAPAGLRRSAAV